MVDELLNVVFGKVLPTWRVWNLDGSRVCALGREDADQ